MRIIFMGTPNFSVPILDALVDAGHDIAAVYSQPPRPAGRGKKDRPSVVQMRAEALGLEVRHPTSLKTDEALAQFKALNADIAVVVAYGLILPQAILDAPRLGCLNIHASLLPRWRGAAPIHRAVMAGDTETGVCIMQMEAGLDTGPVLLRKDTAIKVGETTNGLHNRLAIMGASTIVEAIERLPDLMPQAQSTDGVTYASKIDKAEARVDWNAPAATIIRQINGLSTFPGAWCEANGERIKLLHAAPSDQPLQPAQTHVEDGTLTVGAIDTSVKILRLQRAGKKGALTGDVLKGWTPPSTFD